LLKHSFLTGLSQIDIEYHINYHILYTQFPIVIIIEETWLSYGVGC